MGRSNSAMKTSTFCFIGWKLSIIIPIMGKLSDASEISVVQLGRELATPLEVGSIFGGGG
jgi:hypothetical protein